MNIESEIGEKIVELYEAGKVSFDRGNNMYTAKLDGYIISLGEDETLIVKAGDTSDWLNTGEMHTLRNVIPLIKLYKTLCQKTVEEDSVRETKALLQFKKVLESL